MMIPRYAHERGHAKHGGWLESFHSFSFADYFDRNHMHFSALRVINEDFIAPEGGFGMHPHQNMEILTYVLKGAVAHKDSMGNSEIVPAGEFQIMSAGTGVLHSEFNPSAEELLHLYQIWIMPNVQDITPRYDQKRFDDKHGGTLILSPDAEGESFKVYQDMKLWRYQVNDSHQEPIHLDGERKYWLQVSKGSLGVLGFELTAGDALAISDETLLELKVSDEAEFLLFDLPKIY